MLSIPLEAADPAASWSAEPTPRVLVIGRSEKVLKATVDLLRQGGRAAGATNDFDNVLAAFDVASLDLVVFGGMVPPEKKEALRADLATANPTIAFVQGLAGIPGLIVAQVEAAAARLRRLCLGLLRHRGSGDNHLAQVGSGCPRDRLLGHRLHPPGP